MTVVGTDEAARWIGGQGEFVSAVCFLRSKEFFVFWNRGQAIGRSRVRGISDEMSKACRSHLPQDALIAMCFVYRFIDSHAK